MTKRVASVNNKKDVKEPTKFVGAGIKAFFAVKETSSSSAQKSSVSHEKIGLCSELPSVAINNSEERKTNGDIGHSACALVTPNVAISTGCVDNELNISKHIFHELAENSIIHIIADDAVMPTGKNKQALFPLFGPALKNQPKNIITKDTDLIQKGRSLKLNSSALNDSQDSVEMENDFPPESGGSKNTRKNSHNRSNSNSNKRKINESKRSKEDSNIRDQNSLPIDQVENDKTVIFGEIAETAEISVHEEVQTDLIVLTTSSADPLLPNEGPSEVAEPASEGDHQRGDTTGRRISARLQQRQQIQPQYMEESEDEKTDKKSRKQRRVANAKKSSTNEVISVDSSSSGGRVKQAKKKSSSVVLSDGSDISSESSDNGRRVKRGGKGQTTGKSAEKKNPFFLSKAQRDLLAAQEREQRIQESIARTAAENNKLFAASVDKNRKTAVLFLPQPSSSSTHQGGFVSDVGDGAQRSSTQGDAYDAFQDLSLCAMMSHVGMAAPLSKIRETLQSFQSSERHPLLKWPIPDSIPVPVPPSEKDTAIILDDDTMAWHGMECKDHRRGDDLSSLPLSLQRNYWLAQMNLRFLWTLYCESLSPPVGTVVDLTSSAESDTAVPSTAIHKTSPSHDLVEETTITRWLEYWTAKRRTQRTHSSNVRNESSFPDSDGEEESIVLSKRRQKSETPKKPMRRNGHRGRRRKNSYDDDNDDDEEDVYDDIEEDQDYFSASDSMPRSAISVRSRNIVTDEKALSPIDSLSIVLIIQGPVSSGKTSLVHSTASRMGVNVIESNCSQVRNAAAIKKLFSEAAHSHTIAPATQAVVSSIEGGITTVDLNTSGEMGGSIILFDEVDIIFEEDSSLYNSILQLAKVSKCPIVLTSESAAISCRFKQLSPEVIQLQRRDSKGAARYLTSDEAGTIADMRDENLATLASMLTDGDTRAVALQMQLLSPAQLRVEPARKSFTQLLIENNVDFACFDSFLTALSSNQPAPAECSEPVPRTEAPSEETVCLLAPVVSRVEPRSVMLLQSSDHATNSDDTVSQLNAQLSRSIRIRGRGFTYSKERIASVMASFPDSPHEADISEDLTVRVEVLADEQQCESILVLSDSVITAVLPAAITTGVCNIVVRATFSSRWTVSIRSDVLSSLSDCNWVTVKYSSFGNITAPGTASASKRKPPLGSGSRRKPGRKKAKLSRGRPKAALSTSSDDADADADVDAEEDLNDSQVSEAEEPIIVSQLNDSVDNIHTLVYSDGECDNLTDIRRGNKRLLRMHSKNCGTTSRNEPSGAAYGVAMGEFGSTMDDNEVDTEDTEADSDSDKPIAANAVFSPVKSTNRRRIIESDSEDDVATEIATPQVAEDQMLPVTVTDCPPSSCTGVNLPTLVRTISDSLTHHMSTLLEMIGDPSLHGINRGLVNIAVDFRAQQEVGPESSLDLETVKQSLLENLYTADHAVGDETLTLFDSTSFVSDMYCIIHKSTIPGAAFVLTNVLNGVVFTALQDSTTALSADSSNHLYRCDTVETITEGGDRSVQMSIVLRDSEVSSFELRYPRSEEDLTLDQDISDLCKSGKMGLDPLRQLLMASKTFAGVFNADTSFTFESQTDEVMNDTGIFDDLDDGNAAPHHQMVRFLFSRPKQSSSLPAVDHRTPTVSSEGSLEGICSALDSLSDADVMLSAAQRLQGFGYSAYHCSTMDGAEDAESSYDLAVDDPSYNLDGQRLGHEASVIRRYTAALLGPARQCETSSRSTVRQFVTPPEKDEAGAVVGQLAVADSSKESDGNSFIVDSPFIASELRAMHFTRAVAGFLSTLVSHCNVSPCSTLLSHSAIKGLETGERVCLSAQLAVDIVPMLQLMCRCEARADELARQARERQLSERESTEDNVSPRDYGRGMRIASTRRRNYLLLEGKLAPREPPPLKQFQYMSLVTGFDEVMLDAICKLSLFPII